MKTFINKKSLLTVLKNAAGIVEARSTMPILSNVIIEVDVRKLIVKSTDLESSLTEWIPCDSHLSGSVLIPLKQTIDIIKGLQDGPLWLESENNDLLIKQDDFSVKILGQKLEDFPVFPKIDDSKFFTLNFGGLIDKTIHAVSKDPTRYHLNGTYIESKKKSLIMVATDGHRLTKAEIKGTTTTKDFNAILPTKGLKAIQKLFGCENVDAVTTDSMISLSDLTKTLLIRTVGGKYPNYSQFIPSKFQTEAVIDRKALLAVCKSVLPMCNKKSKAAAFFFDGSTLKVENTEVELGTVSKKLSIELKGPDLGIGFNLGHVIEALQALESDQITIKLQDRLSPCVITAKNDDSVTHVVMPMRIGPDLVDKFKKLVVAGTKKNDPPVVDPVQAAKGTEYQCNICNKTIDSKVLAPYQAGNDESLTCEACFHKEPATTSSPPIDDEEARIEALEAEGMSRSDAQGIVEAENMTKVQGEPAKYNRLRHGQTVQYNVNFLKSIGDTSHATATKQATIFAFEEIGGEVFAMLGDRKGLPERVHVNNLVVKGGQ